LKTMSSQYTLPRNKKIKVHNGGVIYLLFNGNKIVYVGQSKDSLFGRIEHHKTDKKFDSFSFFDCSIHELDDKEAELIIKHKPKYNKSLPGNSVYKNREYICKFYKLTAWEFKRVANEFSVVPSISINGKDYYNFLELPPPEEFKRIKDEYGRYWQSAVDSFEEKGKEIPSIFKKRRR
jgi:hypothetical protein